jgi:hypothetical protein
VEFVLKQYHNQQVTQLTVESESVKKERDDVVKERDSVNKKCEELQDLLAEQVERNCLIEIELEAKLNRQGKT